MLSTTKFTVMLGKQNPLKSTTFKWPPLLSDLAGQRGRYFRVAVTFGWLKNICNSAAVLHKEDV